MRPPLHPELRTLARVLPRGIPSFVVRMSRWLPLPPRSLPAGVSLHVQRTGDVPLRVFTPQRAPAPRPALLWIHGGGYVIGGAKMDDGLCGRFADAAGAVVVSVDYRVAPEHPFPLPLDDCLAGYDFIFREAPALGVDPARVIVGGASAGGGLAAALALRVHDTQRPRPRLQLLTYPMLDDRTVLRAVDDESTFRVWNQASNRMGWRAYLGQEPGGDGVVAYAAAARRVDVAGLPPAWIGVGTNDLFYDEDLAYASRLRAAGVPTTVEVVDGAFHGFDLVAPGLSLSRAFFAAQVQAIRQASAPITEGTSTMLSSSNVQLRSDD